MSKPNYMVVTVFPPLRARFEIIRLDYICLGPFNLVIWLVEQPKLLDSRPSELSEVEIWTFFLTS